MLCPLVKMLKLETLKSYTPRCSFPHCKQVVNETTVAHLQIHQLSHDSMRIDEANVKQLHATPINSPPGASSTTLACLWRRPTLCLHRKACVSCEVEATRVIDTRQKLHHHCPMVLPHLCCEAKAPRAKMAAAAAASPGLGMTISP